jgi:hypothetical protein
MSNDAATINEPLMEGFFDCLEEYAIKCDRQNNTLVRVYHGGLCSMQYDWILAASGKYCKWLKFEFLGVADMTALKWTPKQLIDWLMQSEFHIVGTHVHQGNPSWDVRIVLNQVQRLRQHRGYPFSIHLSCPIFLQDKFTYLSCMRDITNPTLKISIPWTASSAAKQKLYDFCRVYEQGHGWFVKPAFTTNGEGNRRCSSIETVFDALLSLTLNLDRVPYVMLQPKMKNLWEYKVIVLNGTSKYICPPYQQHGGKETRAFTKTGRCRQDILDFAEIAVRRLHVACPSALTEFLVRVDIMESNEGNMIVNEFESFEAMFQTSASEEVKTQSFLIDHWTDVFSILHSF